MCVLTPLNKHPEGKQSQLTCSRILSFLKIRMNDKKSMEEILSDIDCDLLQNAGKLRKNWQKKIFRPVLNIWLRMNFWLRMPEGVKKQLEALNSANTAVISRVLNQIWNLLHEKRSPCQAQTILSTENEWCLFSNKAGVNYLAHVNGSSKKRSKN